MAEKQEQQEAQTEVVEVAPSVLRMQLPIQMPGLGHVNMYCLLDQDGAAVVDPGLPGDASWDAIADRLRQADLRVSDVHTVIVTHSHPDHFGGAGRFHAETGCKVIAHERFSVFGRSASTPHLEVSVEHLQAPPPGTPRPGPRALELQQEDPQQIEPPWMREPALRRRPWGGDDPGPSPEQRERWEKMRASRQSFAPRVTHSVRHGSAIRLAGREFVVWHTPGHTADHVCLHDRDNGVFLSGDHVLPSITPHISGLGEIADPLQAFYDSLDRVAELEGVQRCLPAHGHPFTGLAERAAAIKRHHRERLQKLKSISKQLGPATVKEISEQLFQPRSWGGMAESETYAHLEHLRMRREAEAHEREDGFLVYVTDGP
jgi:glyoxylase-like metal-dependent hydrolase (beta-lactamase superfamily II)